MKWIADNSGTIAALLVVLILVLISLRGILRSRKAGKPACGGCTGCTGECGSCFSAGGCSKASHKDLPDGPGKAANDSGDRILTTVRIGGMMCGMCEAHICDAIRSAFPDAKGVKASFRKGEAVFHTSRPIDPNRLKVVIEAIGYDFISVE